MFNKVRYRSTETRATNSGLCFCADIRWVFVRKYSRSVMEHRKLPMSYCFIRSIIRLVRLVRLVSVHSYRETVGHKCDCVSHGVCVCLYVVDRLSGTQANLFVR